MDKYIQNQLLCFPITIFLVLLTSKEVTHCSETMELKIPGLLVASATWKTRLAKKEKSYILRVEGYLPKPTPFWQLPGLMVLSKGLGLKILIKKFR